MEEYEKELFFELCRFKEPNKEKIERMINEGGASSCTLGALFSNRMAGVAGGVLKNAAPDARVDREFRNSLMSIVLVNGKINDDYFLCVNTLCQILDRSNIPYAFLKGAYLCAWYPRGYRTSNDIDILVSPRDVGKMTSLLKGLGFEQGYIKNGEFIAASREQIIRARMTRGETVPFIKEVNMPYMRFLEVDLNFSLDYKNGSAEDIEKMLGSARTVEIGACKVHTLDSIDFILHLCAHLYKEATTLFWVETKRDMTFYKYCDIYSLVCELDDKSIKELISRAIERKCENALLYALFSTDAFFGYHSETVKQYIKSNYSEDVGYVISPEDQKRYRFDETDIVKLFFCRDRSDILREVV